MAPMPHLWRTCGQPTRAGCRAIWRRRSASPPSKDTDRMAMDAASIEQLIREALPDARVPIEDLRGDGDHYAAHVVSASFKGKTRVQQHQMVYQALQGRMGNE